MDLTELASTVHVLHDPKLRSVSDGYRLLGGAIIRMANDAGLDHQPVPAPSPTLQHAGLEL